jgi:tetratricopeptide (TPR) repeat protein
MSVSNLLIAALGTMLATNQPAALSNLVTQTTGISIPAIDTNSPMALELHKIEEQDDAAAAEVDDWIRQNNEFAKKGAAIPKAELNARIRNKFDASRTAYKDFIQRHPDYAPARVAYASFLHDMGDEDGEFEQLEKARDLDPTIPSVWNNLANYYGEHSPVTNAFACYEKAIQLDPTEPIYFDNFGTSVYLFRKDAREYYHINEQQVFDKALALYQKAVQLDPTNFLRLSDLAMSYYGIKPLRTNDALAAWTNALSLAHDDMEREGVYIHFARIHAQAGQFAESHQRLNSVTNEFYASMKQRVGRMLHDKEFPEQATNNPPADALPPSTTNSPEADLSSKTNSSPRVP